MDPNQLLTIIGMLLPILTATGLLNKYLPFMRNLSNKATPWLNFGVSFLALFGVEAAHAGIFGDIAKGLSVPAKLTVALLASYLQSKLYDKFGGPLLPPGPKPVPR